MDLQRRLTRLGHTVVSLAASGMEAIQKALALHPDVVLMDIRLQGDMDGVEAAQQIHASTAIPVVFMTAYVDADTQQRVGSHESLGLSLEAVQSASGPIGAGACPLGASAQPRLTAPHRRHPSDGALRINYL
jgi:CheY-like chemotaxis protein